MNPELKKMLEAIDRNQWRAEVDLKNSLRMIWELLDAIDKKTIAPESQPTPRWFWHFLFGFAATPILLMTLDVMSS
jgi:hypothetical protein